MAQYELVRFLSGVRLVCYVAVEDEREREVEGGGERSKCFFAACVICFMREQLLLPDNHVFVQQLIEPVSMTLER